MPIIAKAGSQEPAFLIEYLEDREVSLLPQFKVILGF